MQLRYTILFVTDLERSRRFYHELLGIPIRSEDASSIELDTGDTTRVQWVLSVLQCIVIVESVAHRKKLQTCGFKMIVAKEAVHSRMGGLGGLLWKNPAQTGFMGSIVIDRAPSIPHNIE